MQSGRSAAAQVTRAGGATWRQPTDGEHAHVCWKGRRAVRRLGHSEKKASRIHGHVPLVARFCLRAYAEAEVYNARHPASTAMSPICRFLSCGARPPCGRRWPAWLRGARQPCVTDAACGAAHSSSRCQPRAFSPRTEVGGLVQVPIATPHPGHFGPARAGSGRLGPARAGPKSMKPTCMRLSVPSTTSAWTAAGAHGAPRVIGPQARPGMSGRRYLCPADLGAVRTPRPTGPSPPPPGPPGKQAAKCASALLLCPMHGARAGAAVCAPVCNRKAGAAAMGAA